jgi:arylsulfatase A-like enzyme
MRDRRALALGCLVAIVSAGCEPEAPPAPTRREGLTAVGFSPRATRGYVLISLDTLRADHLSCYGYERETSPFLERLIGSGAVVFDRAVVQFPSTLISHMSMFTGYYPRQHGVFPPAAVLSPAIETAPERFSKAGFRTAGHTEGGYVAGAYGFARGFDEFIDTPYADDRDIERTFGRGLAFLGELADDERFFVFLHTYSIHDPYEPPEPYRHAFWDGEPGTDVEAEGELLYRVNRGLAEVDPAAVEYFEALYDGSILYADAVLEQFFRQLGELGLADDTTVIITSDHGEEFFDHDKLAHEQIYPEGLFVPLIVVHPDLDHEIRIPSLVQSIDLAPTLYELAGIGVPEGLAGSSLVPYFEDPATILATEAYAEVVYPQTQKSLVAERDGRLLQLIVTEPPTDPDGIWVPHVVEFDSDERELAFQMISYKKPRSVEVEIDGEPRQTLEVPPRWTPFRIELPRQRLGSRLVLRTAECESPLDAGEGTERRCLGVKAQGLPMRRTELFDLVADPLADTDLGRASHGLAEQLHERLRSYRWEPIAEASWRELDEQTRRTLEALGYL